MSQYRPPAEPGSDPRFASADQPRNTIATVSMVLGIVIFAFRLLFFPFVTNFLIYSRADSSANALSTRIAITNGIGILTGFIAGVLVLVLGFVSIDRGRHLPPTQSRRDQSVVGIVLGFVLLAGAGATFVATLYPILFSTVLR